MSVNTRVATVCYTGRVMMDKFRYLRVIALSAVLAAPLGFVSPPDASAQEIIGYLVPSMGTAKGASKTGAALRNALNVVNKSVGGRSAAGGIRVAGIPMARGRSAANVAGIDKYGRPDKRFTGQRCESIEAGVRVFRGC